MDNDARKLWMLLDDIDTLDDACRDDDRGFRAHVRKVQQKRFEICPNPDGGVTVLPDGSAFAVVSLPLPDRHWLYAEHENIPPMGVRTGTDDPRRRGLEAAIRAAVRYGYRCASMNGKATNIDPDALVQNVIVGLLGYHTPDGSSRL